MINIRFVIMFFLLYITIFIYADSPLQVAVYNESKIDSLYNVMESNRLSYSQKIDVIRHFSSISLYSEYFNKLNPLYNELLKEARLHGDKNGILFCFNSIATLYLGLWDKENVRRYLDSAAVFVDDVSNIQDIALYYGIKAQYIQQYFPNRSPEAIRDYQRSLSYFDKSGIEGAEEEFAIILRNLAMDGFQRSDSTYVFRNIRKIKEVKERYDSPVIDFIYMDILAALNLSYYQTTQEDRYLDRSTFYAKRCLELYELGLLPNFFEHIAVDLYVVTAETMSMKKSADVEVIDSLLSIARQKYNAADSIGVGRIYQTKAFLYFEQDKLDSAEIKALKAHEYLEAGYKNNYYSLVKKNVALLRDIYIKKGDYRKAIAYDDLWTKKDEEMKANVVKELELQFDVDAKDSELRQLNSEIMLYKTRRRIYIVACVLLCLATLFIILLLRSKKKNLNNSIALMYAEREEAKLKLKLKEEQTVKMQLEKYEVLSDFHLKEMELIGKTKDLDQLYRDKEALDKQVEKYRQKFEAYEALEENEGRTNYDVLKVIKEDVKRLVMKCTSCSEVYIQKLESLDESYLDRLCEHSIENLSVSYLKYCVCFVIGMEISEVATCFQIEQSSVHMIRYRLKKKFGLGNDDDLGVFLQDQVY